MKTHLSRWQVYLTAFLLCLAFTARAEEWVHYDARPGSKVTIDGTSTLHPWSVESQLIAGFMEFDASYPLDPSKTELPPLKVVPKVSVSISVRSLKSGKTLMDKVMHDAMNHTKYPKIEYRLKEMSLKPGPRAAGSPIVFDTKGDLTVSGVTKPAAMTVAFERMGGGRLKVSGTYNLKMTDFGVQPPSPTLALGFIKTGDDVKIAFEWVTEAKK